MLALLSKSRGDLDQRLKISQVNGEEHYNFSGVMLLSVFAVSLSQWVLGSKFKDLQLVGEMLTVATIGNQYWIPDHISVSDGVIAEIVGPKREVTGDKRQIVFANELLVYNIRRETKRSSPVAKIRCRSCGGRSYELLQLDCSVEEAILLIHEISSLNVNQAIHDIRVETLMNEFH